jgi:hypothetical protein
VPNPALQKLGKGRRKKKHIKGDMDAMKGYGDDMYEGETSTRHVRGICARFASNRVTRLADIEDLDNRSVHISLLR